jgi:hypothetical protein
MCQPASNPPKAGWIWAADNGCFAKTWKEDRWLAWLQKDHPRSGCLFASVPDVVGDAAATLERWHQYAATVENLGYPVAFVGQDGLTVDTAPWRHMDCFFIGGSTEWKMSSEAFWLADRARAMGKWVHVGRINSGKRYKAWANHADSCDGTFLAWGPKKNTPRMMRWIDRHEENPQLALEVADPG